MKLYEREVMIMAFSNNLRFLRKQHALSQEQLAEKLGYKSFTTIQKWESGVSEPSVSVVSAIAELFGITMDALVNDDLDTYEVHTIAAHHEGEEWSDEELEEIERFKAFVKSKRG